MPPRRNSHASQSQIRARNPEQLQIHMEDGLTYRPHRDPQRIAKNDAKKAAATDQRVVVEGVPGAHLNIFYVNEKIASSDDGNKGDTVISNDSASSVEVGQDLVGAEISPEITTASVEKIRNNNEDIQALYPRNLRSYMPPMTQGYQDHQIPGSPVHFADGISPASSRPFSADLDFMYGAGLLPHYATQSKRADDGLQFTELKLINAGLQSLESQTPTWSPDCSSSLVSPEITGMWRSDESPSVHDILFPSFTEIQQGEYFFNSQDSCQNLEPSFVIDNIPDSMSTKNFDNCFMTGSDDSRRGTVATTCPSEQVDPNDLVGPVRIDILKIVNGMQLADNDLECLASNHDRVLGNTRNCSTEHADLDLFLPQGCGVGMAEESFQMDALL